MTTLREAAQQALEALEAMTKHFGFARLGSSSLADTMKRGDAHVAMNNLRAALAEPVQEPVKQCMAHGECFGGECIYQRPAEPVQEPVAWRWGYRSVTTGEMDWRGYVEIPAHPNLRSPEIIMEPLYAAPPQRKPLSGVAIYGLFVRSGLGAYHQKDFVVQTEYDRCIERFGRAVERAHGIGGEE